MGTSWGSGRCPPGRWSRVRRADGFPFLSIFYRFLQYGSIWAYPGSQSSTLSPRRSHNKVPPFLGPPLCPRNLCAKLGFQGASCARTGQLTGDGSGCGERHLPSGSSYSANPTIFLSRMSGEKWEQLNAPLGPQAPTPRLLAPSPHTMPLSPHVPPPHASNPKPPPHSPTPRFCSGGCSVCLFSTEGSLSTKCNT